MDYAGFKRVIDQQFKRNYDELLARATETPAGGDLLNKIKLAASLQGVSTREAVAGMMSECTVDLFAMMTDVDEHTMEEWDEKITSLVNYLVLLKVVMAERIMAEVTGTVEEAIPSLPPFTQSIPIFTPNGAPQTGQEGQ